MSYLNVISNLKSYLNTISNLKSYLSSISNLKSYLNTISNLKSYLSQIFFGLKESYTIIIVIININCIKLITVKLKNDFYKSNAL